MDKIKWIDRFPKNIKPSYEEFLAFFSDDIRLLFLKFDNEMNNTCKVYNNWQRFDKIKGWVYGYCRNYRCELLYVSIGDDCFYVLGVEVVDEKSLLIAFQKAKEKYDKDYEDRYSCLVAKKKADQIKRTKLRLQNEKEQMEKLKEQYDSEFFNRFKWTPKVSCRKLIQLYKSEAQQCIDEELLDDIGYTFYARCKQAREVREHMNKGQIICHYCNTILQADSYTAVVSCPCGYHYTYREYRRSCNAVNMPGGRATPTFNRFEEKWLLCKSNNEKMMLIDCLIHECHVSVMSGIKGRSVCVNLIEGTLQQLRNTLEMLAGH